jgi:hypothetical protein
MAQNQELIVINGPTNEDVPAFVWSESDFNTKSKLYGHPDKFEFKPFFIKWNLK